MRFAHRRRRDEGEFASPEGGFFATPPQTPPPLISRLNNDLGTCKGELGDFSHPLYVEGYIQTRRRGYIDHPADASATCTPTPPEDRISAAKSRQQHEKSQGGVFGKTPPADGVGGIEAVQDMPADIIAGLRLLEVQPAPTIARPEVWGEVVADAVKLAVDGCARCALDLGWDIDDIFGVGLRSSDTFEGLAVWLAGREVETVARWNAVTTCGAIFYREAFGRPNSPRLPSVLLWQFGRMRDRTAARHPGHTQGQLT